MKKVLSIGWFSRKKIIAYDNPNEGLNLTNGRTPKKWSALYPESAIGFGDNRITRSLINKCLKKAQETLFRDIKKHYELGNVAVYKFEKYDVKKETILGRLNPNGSSRHLIEIWVHYEVNQYLVDNKYLLTHL